ncbi:MAG TPA: fibronectin type III domain-containing protein [Terriglobales bacterium]|nr:fibronectin type III domain-containing protein [Terriglobales bacterium]
MRKRIASIATCAALMLLMVTFASAQAKDVQITKGPTIENVTGNSATIAWSTNTNASTVLKYGTDRNNLNQTAQAPWGGLTHRVTLRNLEPNKTYYYQVTSAQGQGTGSGDIGAIAQFQTTSGPASAANQGQGAGQQSGAQQGQGGADTAQVVVGPIMQQVTENSAVVYWETTKPTENIVKYGTSPNQLTQTAQKPFGGETHKVELTGLQPNTLYHFAIQKPDGTPRTTGYFRTDPAGAATAQGAVRIVNGPNVEYLTPTKAIIAWSTNAPSSSIVKYGQDPNALNQTAQAGWGGTNHRVTIDNLQPNTKYWFSVQSGQAQGTGTMAQTAPYAFQTIQQGQSAMTFKH